jgi:hypothetical protein
MVVLFAQSRIGTASIWTRDSATGADQDQIVLTTSPLPANLHARRTGRLTVAPGQVLWFEVRPWAGQTPVEVVVTPYLVDPRPEFIPATVAPGDTITGETLENSADIDEFTVSGAAPQVHIGFIQAGAGFPSGTLRMRANSLAGDRLGYETSSGSSNTELEGQQTGRFDVPGNAGYRLTIEGLSLTDESAVPIGGAYRFQVREVNLAPDSVSALLQPGDTLEGEAIDFVGDVDQFQVPVVQGRPYNLFLQARSGGNPATLQARYSIGGGTVRSSQ